CYCSYGYALVSLGCHHLAAGLDDLMETTRFNSADCYAGSLRLCWWQDDFIASSGMVFLLFVLMVVSLMFVVMSLVVMSIMMVLLEFVIMSFVVVYGHAVTGA